MFRFYQILLLFFFRYLNSLYVIFLLCSRYLPTNLELEVWKDVLFSNFQGKKKSWVRTIFCSRNGPMKTNEGAVHALYGRGSKCIWEATSPVLTTFLLELYMTQKHKHNIEWILVYFVITKTHYLVHYSTVCRCRAVWGGWLNSCELQNVGSNLDQQSVTKLVSFEQGTLS